MRVRAHKLKFAAFERPGSNAPREQRATCIDFIDDF